MAISKNTSSANKTLIVLLGPTGVGKTDLALKIADFFDIPIINADSRQIYKGIEIGTAAPTPAQLSARKHYFVGELNLEEYYSAACFENDVLDLLKTELATHQKALLTGGSMLYIDAVCNGIDDIPTVDIETRTIIKERLEQEGLQPLLEELRVVDPESYQNVDHKNPRRIVHALEIYYSSGKKYSSFIGKERPKRPFNIIKIGINRERTELFDRINSRVDKMIQDGLLDEVRRVYPQRELNSLHTVGYNELFKVLDGDWALDMAIERIKKNSRVYAKKQLTWWAHDTQIKWFHPSQTEDILKYLTYAL